MSNSQVLVAIICYTYYTAIICSHEYDFIVVGVESAGSILAARVSEPNNNWSVLALDRDSARNFSQQDISDDKLSGVHDPNYFSIAQAYLLGRLLRILGIMVLAERQWSMKWQLLLLPTPTRSPVANRMEMGWSVSLNDQNASLLLLLSTIITDWNIDEDCRRWHGKNEPMDIAPALFGDMPDFLFNIMKKCDQGVGYMPDYDNPTRQYGCYFQQQFRQPLNKSDPSSSTIRKSAWNVYPNGTDSTNLHMHDSATVLKLLFDETESTK